MDTFFASTSPDLGPIDPDWTIGALVEWLSEDSRQHDPALRGPLARIDAELAGARWTHSPSTVALIRSIADAVIGDPAIRRIRIRDLGSPDPTSTSTSTPERLLQLA
ncbi:hypothetical protein [Microbacterium sp. LWH11-1.2]|uniref:hypothetical protein n=1 Tax=unclassified Microbacterium TaxID=2609290 RepID=UPI0031386DB1